MEKNFSGTFNATGPCFVGRGQSEMRKELEKGRRKKRKQKWKKVRRGKVFAPERRCYSCALMTQSMPNPLLLVMALSRRSRSLSLEL